MLFFNTLEEVPEEFRLDYVESELDGKKGFQHKRVVSLVNALNTTKADKERIKEKFDKYEADELKRIEEVTKKAEADALEKAKNSGEWSQMEEILNQKIMDADRRAVESEEKANKRLLDIAKTQEKSIASNIAAKYSIDGAEQALERLIAPYITIDPDTGARSYLDDEGNATSLDDKGFVAELYTKALFKPLLAGNPTTTGGGQSKGAKGSKATLKSLKEMNEAERLEWKQRDPDGFRTAVAQSTKFKR